MRADQQKLDDYALLAWGKFKAQCGRPEESFTDRDREMFIARSSNKDLPLGVYPVKGRYYVRPVNEEMRRI